MAWAGGGDDTTVSTAPNAAPITDENTCRRVVLADGSVLSWWWWWLLLTRNAVVVVILSWSHENRVDPYRVGARNAVVVVTEILSNAATTNRADFFIAYRGCSVYSVLAKVVGRRERERDALTVLVADQAVRQGK